MNKSTPHDLAVTFRSLARRQREAIGELHQHVEAAAKVLGTPSDANAVADALVNRPADAWDVETLDTLRQEALAIGAVLRRIAATTGADDQDD